MAKTIKPLKRITLPFPRELITEDIDLKKYLEEWNCLLLDSAYQRERFDTPYSLLVFLKDDAKAFTNQQLFKLITCPFNTSDPKLVNYWLKCCLALKNFMEPEASEFDENDLTECEIEYSALDIRYYFAKTFGFSFDFTARRLDLCIKINNLLLGNKSLFIARCKKCGRRLPITHLYNTCDECRGKASLYLPALGENDSMTSSTGSSSLE